MAVHHCRNVLVMFLATGIAILNSGEVQSEPYVFPQNYPIAKALTAAPENSWVKLSTNKYSDAWTPVEQRPCPPGVPSCGGPHSIIRAWSSFAWDSNRGNLIMFGGGHANYAGNDVYLWNAKTLQWERGSLPSDVARTEPDEKSARFAAVDGILNAPVAAHTYDNSEFLPVADRFITFGGASFNTGSAWKRPIWVKNPDGTFTPILDAEGNQIKEILTGPYLWDPSKANPNQVGGTTGSQVNPARFPNVLGANMWENRDNLDPSLGPRPGQSSPNFVNGTTAYTEEGGKDVLFVEMNTGLWKYTIPDLNFPLSDTYEQVGRRSTPISGSGAGAYDKDRKLFVRVAAFGSNGFFTYWSLAEPGPRNGNVVFRPAIQGEGSFDVTKLFNYGLEYDPLRQRFLMWNGAELWELKAPAELPGEWSMTRLLGTVEGGPNAFDTSNPNLKVFTGILGKWKYAATLDVFLTLFDPVDGTVWAYKPAGWSPTFGPDAELPVIPPVDPDPNPNPNPDPGPNPNPDPDPNPNPDPDPDTGGLVPAEDVTKRFSVLKVSKLTYNQAEDLYQTVLALKRKAGNKAKIEENLRLTVSVEPSCLSLTDDSVDLQAPAAKKKSGDITFTLSGEGCDGMSFAKLKKKFKIKATVNNLVEPQ